MSSDLVGRLHELVNSKTTQENALLKSWSASKNSSVPQRYRDNIERYVDRGGEVRPQELMAGFVAGNERNQGDMARFHFFCLVFDQILKEGVEGHVAEVGVYKGNTATLLAAVARRLNTTAWLIDTFEGFSASDLEGVDADKSMQFSDTSLEAVQALVGHQNVRFLRGHFPGTASQISDTAAFSLVHIDCDLYLPFKSALEYFYPRLSPGGFLIMHDYSSLHWDGAETAVDEFFADKPESPMPVPDAAGTVAIRKFRQADPIYNWRNQARRDGFAKRWLSAANGGLSDYLGHGWSNAEAWGIWGIGPCHTLKLYLDARPSGDFIFEADVTSALVGRRTTQEVTVSLGQDPLEIWYFSMTQNCGVRSLRVPQSLVAEDEGYPVLSLTFRPRNYESPQEIEPDNADNRELGLGIYRIRYRIAWPHQPTA